MDRLSSRLGVIRRGLCFLILAAAIPAVGCGEPKLTVNGTVTVKGQPLSSGIVQIHGPGDRLETAPLQPDGTFIVTDLPPGEVKVTVVEDIASKPGSGGTSPPKAGGPSPAGTQGAAAKSVPIPAKYKDANTSGLNYTITPSTKTLQIKLD